MPSSGLRRYIVVTIVPRSFQLHIVSGSASILNGTASSAYIVLVRWEGKKQSTMHSDPATRSHRATGILATINFKLTRVRKRVTKGGSRQTRWCFLTLLTQLQSLVVPQDHSLLCTNFGYLVSSPYNQHRRGLVWFGNFEQSSITWYFWAVFKNYNKSKIF